MFGPGWLLFGVAGLLLCTVTLAARQTQTPARTTKDGVYTKEQATAGQATFDKFCASCHLFKPGDKPSPNPDLAGEAFLTTWTGRTVKELQTIILTTMPNDGSMVLTPAQTVDVVAYLLQQNGFAPGTRPLPDGDAAAAITIAK
jgi:mono/diheme cytochrome c family protein